VRFRSFRLALPSTSFANLFALSPSSSLPQSPFSPPISASPSRLYCSFPHRTASVKRRSRSSSSTVQSELLSHFCKYDFALCTCYSPSWFCSHSNRLLNRERSFTERLLNERANLSDFHFLFSLPTSFHVSIFRRTRSASYTHPTQAGLPSSLI